MFGRRETSPEEVASDVRTGMLFEQAMAQTRMAVCLVDPHGPDAPIVFANSAFEELTGYGQDEVIGRNCRFLQGPDTDQATVAKLRDAIRDEKIIVVELLNYRKSGMPFWNALHIGPVYDESGQLKYFFGSQWDVTDVHFARAEQVQAEIRRRELSHRMQNMFSVIGSIITVVGRVEGQPKFAERIAERIYSLGRANAATEVLLSNHQDVDVGKLVAETVGPYATGPEVLDVSGCENAPLNASDVSIIGIMLHELAVNAVKYGAFVTPDGRVVVSCNLRDSTHLHFRWEEFCRHEIDTETHGSGTGLPLIRRFAERAGGCADFAFGADGLRFGLQLPLKR